MARALTWLSLGVVACAPVARHEPCPPHEVRAGSVPTKDVTPQKAPAPRSAEEALRPFFESLELPKTVAPPGPPPPDPSRVIRLVSIGSCQSPDQPLPTLARAAAESPDLFVFLGDNVYGDMRGDVTLPELREAYASLADHPDFELLRERVPTLAVWDDHDFGLNDAGSDFVARVHAKRLFESFWGTSARTAERDGIYDAFAFGPAGRRLQIVLLDTRFGRSALTRRASPDGRGPYEPSLDPDQRMLSDAQWSWLEKVLAEPADLRLVASSIQVLADGHDYEAWDNLPRERARLFQLFDRLGTEQVIFLSGDRHLAALYRDDRPLGVPVYELTSSSLNRPSHGNETERSSNQLGDVYLPANYGSVRIDWDAGAVTLEVKNERGEVVRDRRVQLDELARNERTGAPAARK